MFIYRNSDENTINIIEQIYKKIVNDSELQKYVETSYNKIIMLKSKYNIL